ncbi:DNA-binding transcriptional regulator, GntR family [Jannaschia faecimaris]|uniref:DNA-binding transcriptional regulator, GntR family n=1 Tax=Jannaschia faecimaris TaxID=1244108 RepID=A0A1H3U9Z6_9RHOB|nr:GntR family transcriptional regulator [Jannaschia faecimaris]SDZ59208.1 DNA-binding transcriptional regulator, GntR family [Jannaschia faecimaris]
MTTTTMIKVLQRCLLYAKTSNFCIFFWKFANSVCKIGQSLCEGAQMQAGRQPKMNATEHAYHIIRNDILTGKLKEGERLTETRLSDDLGLSRTPIREAIGRLIIEGFIDRQSGYTTRVAYFPEDEAEQVYEIRRLVECYSVQRAARLANEEDIAELRRIHAAMQADTPPRDQDAYQRLTAANEAFHRAIVAAARSPRLTALMTTALDVSMVVRTYSMFSDRDLQRSLNHHEEIIQAIEARAPEWAASIMSAHLLAGASRVTERMAQNAAGKE